MHIEIKVGKETLALQGQDNCFVICRFQSAIRKHNGEPDGWRPFLWYTTLDAAINGLLKMKIARSDVGTLIDLQFQIKKAKEELAGIYS